MISITFKTRDKTCSKIEKDIPIKNRVCLHLVE